MQVKGVGAGLVIVGAAAAVYFRVLRPWHLHWGATAEEASGEVAGDELMPAPDIVATRVVRIGAPPSAIVGAENAVTSADLASWASELADLLREHL